MCSSPSTQNHHFVLPLLSTFILLTFNPPSSLLSSLTNLPSNIELSLSLTEASVSTCLVPQSKWVSLTLTHIRLAHGFYMSWTVTPTSFANTFVRRRRTLVADGGFTSMFICSLMHGRAKVLWGSVGWLGSGLGRREARLQLSTDLGLV